MNLKGDKGLITAIKSKETRSGSCTSQQLLIIIAEYNTNTSKHFMPVLQENRR